MKRSVVFCAAALILTALPSLAQRTPGADRGQGQRPQVMSVDDQVAQLAKELNLDENQKTQVKAILQNQSDEMQKLRQDSSVSQEDRRTKFQALRSTSTTKIKALLTADQATKYDDYLSKQRGHRQQGAPGGAQPGNPPVQ